MALLSIPKELDGDEYLMGYIRRSFDSMKRLVTLPNKVVYSVSGPLIPNDSYEISPVMVSTGKGAVMIQDMDRIELSLN